jgi:hypothetical protein
VTWWRRFALALPLALAAAACGGASGPIASPTPTPTPTPVTASPSVSPSVDPCSKDYLVPWFKSFIDGTAEDLVIVDAEVVACRNGYAHVYAIPQRNPEGQNQYDSEQFWLKWEDGDWVGVAQGTGITCSDPDRTPEHAAACDALGES